MEATGDGDSELIQRLQSSLGASSLRKADIVSAPFSLSDSTNLPDLSSFTKPPLLFVSQFPLAHSNTPFCKKKAALLPLNTRGLSQRPPLKSPSSQQLPPQEALPSGNPSPAFITRSHSVPQPSLSYCLSRPPSLMHSSPQPIPRVSDPSSIFSKCSKMPSPKNTSSTLSHPLMEDVARALSDPSWKTKLSVDVMCKLGQAPPVITRRFASQPPSPSANVHGGGGQNSSKFLSVRVDPLKEKRHRRSHSDNLFMLDSEMLDSALQTNIGGLFEAQIVREIELEKQGKTVTNGELSLPVWQMDSAEEDKLETLSVLHKQGTDEKDSESVENDWDRDGDGGEDLFSMYIDMENIDDGLGGKDEEDEKTDCKRVPGNGGSRGVRVDPLAMGFEDSKNNKALKDGKKDNSEKSSLLLSSTNEDLKEKLSPGSVQDQPATGNNSRTAGEQSNLGVSRKTNVGSLGSHHARSISMDSLLGCGDEGTENRRLRHSHSNSIDGSTNLKRELVNEEADNPTKKVMANDKLSEIALVDPKRAKRILANRQSAARSKERKVRYITELEGKVQNLQTEAASLSSQLTLLQRDLVGLLNENNELKLRLHAMEQQAQLRDALNDALCEEVRRLKLENHKRNGVAAGKIISVDEQLFQVQQAPQMQQQHGPKHALVQFPTPLNFVQNLFGPLQAFGGAYGGQLLKADLPSVAVSSDPSGQL